MDENSLNFTARIKLDELFTGLDKMRLEVATRVNDLKALGISVSSASGKYSLTEGGKQIGTMQLSTNVVKAAREENARSIVTEDQLILASKKRQVINEKETEEANRVRAGFAKVLAKVEAEEVAQKSKELQASLVTEDQLILASKKRQVINEKETEEANRVRAGFAKALAKANKDEVDAKNKLIKDEKQAALEARRTRREGAGMASSSFLAAGGLAIGALGTAGFPALNVGFATMSAAQMGLGAAGTVALGAIVGITTAMGELVRAGLRLQEEFKTFASSTFELSGRMEGVRKEVQSNIKLQEQEAAIRRGLVYEMTSGAKAAEEFKASLDSVKLGFGMMGSDLIGLGGKASFKSLGNATGIPGLDLTISTALAPITAIVGFAKALNDAGAAELENSKVAAALKSFTSVGNFLGDMQAEKLAPSMRKAMEERKKIADMYEEEARLGSQSAAMWKKALRNFDASVMPIVEEMARRETETGRINAVGFRTPQQAAENYVQGMAAYNSPEVQSMSLEMQNMYLAAVRRRYDDEMGITELAKKRAEAEKKLTEEVQRSQKAMESSYTDRMRIKADEAASARSIHESLRTEEESFTARITEINDLYRSGAYTDTETALSDMVRTAMRMRKSFQTEFMGFGEYNRKISSMAGTSSDDPTKADIDRVTKAVEAVYGPRGVEAFKRAFKEAIAEMDTGYSA